MRQCLWILNQQEILTSEVWLFSTVCFQYFLNTGCIENLDWVCVMSRMMRQCLWILNQQETTRPSCLSLKFNWADPHCVARPTMLHSIRIYNNGDVSSYTVHIKLTTMAKMPQSGPAWPRVAHINQGDPETNFQSILDQTCSLTNFSPPHVFSIHHLFVCYYLA